MQRLSVLSLLVTLTEPCLGYYRRPPARHLHHRDVNVTYDYIIIGGGTAGLTVADRLTGNSNTTVLVIEHGELVDSPSIDTVSGGFMGMSDAQLMYDIMSVPQANLRNRTTAVLAGKVVGGSSAVNAMMTVRGTSEDYDRWGQFFSNGSTWSWTGLLPYLKRALNFVPPDADVEVGSEIMYNTSYWGNSSGVYAGWPSFQYPGTSVLLDAFRGMPGVQFPGDSGAGETGVYWFPTFMDPTKVTRSYARTGHYDRAVNRSNYHLITESKVTKILLDGTTATGVSFRSVAQLTNGTNTTGAVIMVRARKEVILAAGGIHSPYILQLSGIGPKKVLSAASISTIVDLPGVGQNFQDHPMLTAMWIYQNFTMRPSADDLFANATFASWADAHRYRQCAAWLSFPVISSRWAEIAANLSAQNHAAYLPAATDPTVVAGYSAQMKSYANALRGNGTAFYNNVLTGGSGSGAMVDLHPLSRGTVNIDTTDPEGREPVVDYRALTNPLDMAIMTEMLRFSRRYYMNNTHTARFSPVEVIPGANVTTDEQWAEYIADTLSPTEFHPAGTCAMMPRELGGVVDEELRVFGVKNLRVVDASIMPMLPGANICQTVYAIAEKAADLIRGSET
ncbi:oxygen-dependent choline dehydrogenase [Diplogelasinospora grovesii]|uniref:Oxygen-dependent choline dehydrogenase n=1 Tax=Diplogelasinospora grovesii TaxID=303347 RepID=A0AAN6N4C5_9PEZI|nr:oxygen-dependent choline dehydrogenase [Diplogelasinospora grovesii]